MVKIIIVLNVYVILVSTIVHQLEYVVNAQRKLSDPPTFTRCCKKCFGAFRNSIHVSEITWKTVCVTIQSHVTNAASGLQYILLI